MLIVARALNQYFDWFAAGTAVIMSAGIIMLWRAATTGMSLSWERTVSKGNLPTLHKKKMFQVHATIWLLSVGILGMVLGSVCAPTRTGNPFVVFGSVGLFVCMFTRTYISNGYRSDEHGSYGFSVQIIGPLCLGFAWYFWYTGHY